MPGFLSDWLNEIEASSVSIDYGRVKDLDNWLNEIEVLSIIIDYGRSKDLETLSGALNIIVNSLMYLYCLSFQTDLFTVCCVFFLRRKVFSVSIWKEKVFSVNISILLDYCTFIHLCILSR